MPLWPCLVDLERITSPVWASSFPLDLQGAFQLFPNSSGIYLHFEGFLDLFIIYQCSVTCYPKICSASVLKMLLAHWEVGGGRAGVREALPAQSPRAVDFQIPSRWGQICFALRTCLLLAIITGPKEGGSVMGTLYVAPTTSSCTGICWYENHVSDTA